MCRICVSICISIRIMGIISNKKSNAKANTLFMRCAISSIIYHFLVWATQIDNS